MSPELIEYFKLLQLTYEKAKEMEVTMQKQAKCPQWHKLRYPRLKSQE